MNRIIFLLILITIASHSNAQTDNSDVLKYYSKMRMVVDIKDSNKQTDYEESSLIIMDFKTKTINVHPNQFNLDMVKLLPETEAKDYTAVNILCVDNKQKECTVSTSYFKSGVIIIRITFDDFDYVYYVKNN